MRFAWLLLLLSVVRAEAKPCRAVSYKPTVVSKDAGGAAVVMATPDPAASGYGEDDQRVDVAIQGWSFADGTAPKVQSIAPGLAIYSGKGQLLDKLRNPVATIRAATGQAKQLAAPAIKGVKLEQYRRGYSVIAELADKPPAGAIALVVFDSKKQGRSFGEPSGSDQITVFHVGSCAGTPPATVSSTKGESIFLAWLDGNGRLSPMTAATIK